MSGHTFLSEDKSLYVSDLHDENILKTPNNDLIIIDAELRLNTPELGAEGTYIPKNTIRYTNEALTEEDTSFDDLQMAIESSM